MSVLLPAWSLGALLALAACSRLHAEPAGTGGEAGQEAAPPLANPEFDALYRALSAREPPSCEELDALVDEPVPALEQLAEQARMPPWVAPRAAACLALRHAEEARASLLRWLGDERSRGLALAVLDQLDDLPDEALAVELARAALAGPLGEEARERLGRSERASLRELLGTEEGD